LLQSTQQLTVQIEPRKDNYLVETTVTALRF
jgi:hypothetical protein